MLETKIEKKVKDIFGEDIELSSVIYKHIGLENISITPPDTPSFMTIYVIKDYVTEKYAIVIEIEKDIEEKLLKEIEKELADIEIPLIYKFNKANDHVVSNLTEEEMIQKLKEIKRIIKL